MKDKVLKTELIVLLFFLTAGAGNVYAEPYGWSPNVDNSWKGPPSHVGPKIDKAPIIMLQNFATSIQGGPAIAGQPSGAIGLRWHKVPGVTSYNIYYGLSPKNYIYSAIDIGDTDNFTLRYLANKIYYIAIQAKNGYSVSDLSNEFAVRPGRGGGLVAAAGFTPVKKNTLGVQKTLGTTSQYTQPPVEIKPKGSVEGTDTTAPTTNIGSTQQTTPYTPPPAPPKPKSWWQKILSIFFGK